ncbi:photosystem II assembly protein [Phormidium sp. LEGE 05292]|uniref:photosystem II assembly protein n=1 Tax=[Phormidium] sp. LEGE 05292 TaxID=767427 RepID=UPI001880FB3E|nr:photosystem II assembly protein [Phormidium sp. LEGE 05292]MBE9228028.1 photosystem II assembly protein [Phormidium sp. LEGE 05292]
MINLIVNFWRSVKLCLALYQGNTTLAEKILHQIEQSGAKLTWIEQLFRDRLQSERNFRTYRQQIAAQHRQLNEFRQKLEDLELNTKQSPSNLLTPIPEFIELLSKKFKLIEHDESMVQCTGIDRSIFDEFEAKLADFIKDEFNRLSERKNFYLSLEDAIEDINLLKSGQDPQYKFELSPHVYLMRYFLDNVYCAYLSWFLIYKSGLLPTKINVLDIAAGSGTIAYGLALLLQSITEFSTLDTQHISYYSLEQHKDFQYRGLQFWRSYIERQKIATNAYFRFDTSSIFDYNCQSRKIPLNFFDFIVISHCFFSNPETRIKSQTIYQQIFSNHLKKNGYVLLIIQDKKLLKAYNVRQSEDPQQEELTVKTFVEDLGLKLVWYQYLTSRYSRKPISNFGKFARENLACQKFMSPLLRQYFKLNFDSNYTLDDYVILAQSLN